VEEKINLTFPELCAWLTLLLPLFSFLLTIVISERYAWIVSLSSSMIMLTAVVFSSLLLFDSWNQDAVSIELHWFSIPDHTFTANLLLSNQSMLMLFVVSVISFLVHVYSIGYMAADQKIRRYFSMLGFFTFSMQGIVLSDSLLALFVFWELVGFSSYLLIGHYMSRPEAGAASKKAFIMNRIGDAGFLIGLMIVWAQTGTFSLSVINSNTIAFDWQTAASLCIFCGVMGKSAQFPLFTWLPDAMEGPTPVSALIHAATMVAAGVYLMTRIFPLFTPTALAVVAFTGAVTSLVGALGALSQYDIKKILAYSTISQLGLMIMAIGMGLVNAALLHLYTHAFFKACLFLCAGAVIHALHHAQQRSSSHFDVQDIRNMGGLSGKMRVTLIAFLISGASLAGIPFFSGFLSKEAILSALWSFEGAWSWSIIITMVTVSFLTVVYTFRLIWFVFFAEEKNSKNLVVIDVPAVMRAPIVLLAVFSLWFIVSWNPFDFTGWLVPADGSAASAGVTVFSAILVIVALAFGWLMCRGGVIRSSGLLRNAFYLDSLNKALVHRGVLPAATATHFLDKRVIDKALHLLAYTQVTFAHIIAWIDRNVVDGLVHFFAKTASGIGALARSFQGGKIQLYIFWGTFAIIIFLICALN
jgi:NADH-quinone oxidoreductase subunit L